MVWPLLAAGGAALGIFGFSNVGSEASENISEAINSLARSNQIAAESLRLGLERMGAEHRQAGAILGYGILKAGESIGTGLGQVGDGLNAVADAANGLGNNVQQTGDRIADAGEKSAGMIAEALENFGINATERIINEINKFLVYALFMVPMVFILYQNRESLNTIDDWCKIHLGAPLPSCLLLAFCGIFLWYKFRCANEMIIVIQTQLHSTLQISNEILVLLTELRNDQEQLRVKVHEMSTSQPATDVVEQVNDEFEKVPLYRLFNSKILDHFYTANYKEAMGATSTYGYTLQGTIGKIAVNKPTSENCAKLVPIYRHNNGHDHFYTTNLQEAIGSGQYGYKSEGIAGYCSPTENYCNATVKLHRFSFARGARGGDHFYTTSEEEVNRVKAGLCGPVSYEGVMGYIWT